MVPLVVMALDDLCGGVADVLALADHGMTVRPLFAEKQRQNRLLLQVPRFIFVALQLFSYPGDYVRQEPTFERIAETLLKFEQDTIGHTEARAWGPRRAIVPIKVFIGHRGSAPDGDVVLSGPQGRPQAEHLVLGNTALGGRHARCDEGRAARRLW